MLREDLQINKIYVYRLTNRDRIFKFQGIDNNCQTIDTIFNCWEKRNWNFKNYPLRESTEFEKYWYSICKESNVFILEEEAQRLFKGNSLLLKDNKITPKLVKIWNKLLNKKNYYEKE